METQKKNYVLPIAMMFALFAMISFVTGLQNPMGIIVKNQFGASNFMSQLGNAANFIAYAFMGLPAGPDAPAHRLQEDGARRRGRRLHRRRHLLSFGSDVQFQRLSDRRLRFGFLDVYAQYGGQPHAQYAGRRRQPRQPARAVRRFAQLAGRHDRSGAGRLSHGERRTGHDQQRRTRPVHRHGHLRAGLRRDARDGDSRTGSP